MEHEVQAGFIESEINRLFERIAPFGLVPQAEVFGRLVHYAQLLLSWNRRVALLSRRDEANVVRKHVAISLAPFLLQEYAPTKEWVDVGTGAGLPGVVVKIWNPSIPMTLIEGSRKKCMFLEDAVSVLALDGVNVQCARVETVLARDQHQRFDVVLVRAVADLVTTLRDFGDLVRPGGVIITFKGPNWSDEVAAAAQLGVLKDNKLEQVLEVPWTHGHLLQIRRRG